MLRMFSTLLLAGWLLGSAWSSVQGGGIEWTSGGADVTFYFESQAEGGPRWHTVFRKKAATTEVSGLDTPFDGFTGIVGHQKPGAVGDIGDYVLNKPLIGNLSSPQTVMLGGDRFFTTGYRQDGQIDFGLRTRLRENQVALGIGESTVFNQFDGFRLTLDVAGSNLANGAEFVMYGQDGQAVIDTRSGLLSADWSNFAHDHWALGFTAGGDHYLQWSFQGVGGQYGSSAPVGSFGFIVSAVPEPSSLALGGLVALTGGGAWVVRRRRKLAAKR
jgi:hypothetical protein